MAINKIKPFIYNLDFVKEQSKKELFNVVSLFAGGGGSSTGYRLAGGKILAINEFIPEAQRVYSVNYPDTYIFKQDIRKLTGQMILDKLNINVGDLDILDGSPPCSSFSMAGSREKGWGKEKIYSDSCQRTDDLFFEYARIVKDMQPKVFIAENVKGITMGEAQNLLGSQQMGLFGEHENTIYHTLFNAGYNVRYKVLNAKHYGVPQSRERTIFIGVRKDIKKPISYPKICSNEISVFDAINSVSIESYKKLSKEQSRVYDLQLPGESMVECGKRLNQKISGVGRIRLNGYKSSNTATTKPELWHPTQKRSISIGELKRICSFPDDYYTGVLFSKQWERLGRAVPPLMMKAIAEHVYETILK